MPAPPHDDSGHTWHHPDEVLFGITKFGVVAPYAPKGYESDMPGFGDRLSDDEIWAVLAFIKASWSPRVQAARAEMLRDRGRAMRITRVFVAATLLDIDQYPRVCSRAPPKAC